MVVVVAEKPQLIVVDLGPETAGAVNRVVKIFIKRPYNEADEKCKDKELIRPCQIEHRCGRQVREKPQPIVAMGDVGQNLLHEIKNDHGQREIHQGKIVAAQAHEHRTDSERHHDSGCDTDQNANIRIGAEIVEIKGSSISTDREIGWLAEGNEANAAQQEVAANGVDRKNHNLVGER